MNVRTLFTGLILALLAHTMGNGAAQAGSIVSWGYDGYGVVSGAPTGTGYTAIAGGIGNGLALASDGSIVSWGDDVYGMVSGAPTGTGYTSIAGGYFNGVALASDGSIVAWGDDSFGLVSGTPTGTGYTAIAAVFYNGLALTSAIPEASTMILSSLGLIGLGVGAVSRKVCRKSQQSSGHNIR